MSTEKIESLISPRALAEFDELTSKIDKGVSSFEKLVSQVASLNKALGSSKTISEINTQISKLSEKQTELGNTTQKLIDLQTKLTSKEKEIIALKEQLARAQSQENAAVQSSVTTLNSQNKALLDNVQQLNNYKAALASIKSQQKDLQTLYKNGVITLEEYRTRYDQLTKQQLQAKSTAQQLNSVISAQIKENQAAQGSIEQLKNRLVLLTKAFDNLSSSERKTSVGKEIKRQINDLTKDLSKLEQSTGRFQRNVGNYSSGIMGLARSLGTLFGITSAVQMGQAIFEVNRRFDELNKSIELISGTSENYATNQRFLIQAANDYGLEIEGLTGGFRSFYAAATNAGLSAEQTRNIFDSVSKVAGNLKLSQESVNSVLLAFGQIASKGRVQSEELRGQIGERVPGAFAIAAKAVGVTGAELNKMLEQGLVPSVEFLPKFAAELEKTFGKEDEINSLTASVNRFFNVIKSGVQSTKLTEFLTGLIDVAGKVVGGLFMIGEGFANLISDAYAAVTGGPAALAANRAIREVTRQTEEAERNRQWAIEARVDAYKDEEDATKRTLMLQEQQSNVTRTNLLLGAAIRSGNKEDINYARERLKYEKAILDGYIAFNSTQGKLNPFEKKKTGSKKSPNLQVFDDELKAQVDQLKKLSQFDGLYLDTRLQARRAASETELQILELNYQKDIINAKDNLNQREVIDKKYAFNRKQIEENLQNDLKKIRFDARDTLDKGDTDISKQFVEEERQNYEGQLLLLTQYNEKQIAVISKNRDEELEILNNKYSQGLINQEKYGKERERIEKQAAILILKEELAFTEAYIALAKTRGEDVSEQEARLAGIRLEISKITTETIIDDQNKIIKDTQKVLRILETAYNETTGVIGDFIQARVDRQKNAIQDEIDMIQKRTQVEIEAINRSTLSSQEKADKIAVINARSQAQRESLERRQRLLDLQRARYEKAAGIGRIVINTAQGVTAALAQYPPNIPLAIAVGALGAAQLAVAIATPLPRFAQGTKDAPGGPAIVGDGGRRELVVTPQGQLIETPSTPTIMNIPKHSVVHPDSKKALSKNIYNPKSVINLSDDSKYFMLMASKLDRINSTLKSKSEINIVKSKDGWNIIKRSGNDWSEYINRSI